MLILKNEEINLEKILERFDKSKGMYHELELDSSEDDNKLNNKDWKCLCQKVSEDYLSKNKNPALVIIDMAHRMDRIWRTFCCHSTSYNLIK